MNNNLIEKFPPQEYEYIYLNSEKQNLKNSSTNFRGTFFLKFTKELIKNSKNNEIFRLKEILRMKNLLPNKTKKRIIKPRQPVKKKINKDLNSIVNDLKTVETTQKLPLQSKPIQNRPIIQKPVQNQPIQNQALQRNYQPPQKKRFYQPDLPNRLKYLSPQYASSKKLNLDFGKLNQFINNPKVQKIECLGEGTPINIILNSQTMKTNITLNKDEIDNIIDTFSINSKIPIQEGVYKVVLGDLMLTAIISNITVNQFRINRMPPEAKKHQNTPPIRRR